MRTGRPPKGGEIAERTACSAEAKRRARAILDAMRGALTVAQACAEMGVGEARYYQLRDRFLAEGVAGLEPRPGGRPRKAPPQDAEVRELEARVARLELELKAAQIREQIALVLPRLARGEGAPAKKRRKGKKKVRARRRT